MNFIISASTDIGLKKSTNQDSLSVKIANTEIGRVSFAILCDGMGGLSKGEIASATVVTAFNNWFENEFPLMCINGISNYDIQIRWNEIVQECKNKIMRYGFLSNVTLGTTVVVLLLTETKYFLLNVGDSRAYKISDNLYQMTQDHTVVEKAIQNGEITPEQAKTDPRRSVLLQCVGASDEVIPDMFFGNVEKNAVYMLCSDGFRHEITTNEIYQYLQPSVMKSKEAMKNNSDYLIELNKQRKETDNISVVTVLAF